MIVAAVLGVAILIGAALALVLANRSDPSEIRQEPILTAGDNPFMPSAGSDRAGLTPPQRSGGTFGGGTTGLYGGTMNTSVCDRDQAIRFLEASPDKQAAWAQVQEVSPTAVSGYLRQLTPVLLRSDTLVTDHGFADGHATTLNSVLQAGSAVLVDTLGVPRTRCYSGNPLTPPATVQQPSYSGQSWNGFAPSALTRVEPAPAPIGAFTIVDPGTEATFSRPAGTAGESDSPVAATPPTEAAPPPPPAPVAAPPAPPSALDLTPTEITFPHSDLQVGQRIHFDSGVRNLSDTPSGNFNVKWLVNGKEVQRAGHSGVAAHATDTAGTSQFDGTFPTPGTYKVTFLVDSESSVPDANRANNSTTIAVDIAGPKIDPQLDESPKSGGPGTTVTIEGTGFKPDEKVTFAQSGSNVSGGGGSIKTNSDGKFSISFKIHNGTEPGDITTKFSQDGINESVKFKVTG